MAKVSEMFGDEEESEKPSFAKKRGGDDMDETYKKMGKLFYEAMVICMKAKKKEKSNGEAADSDDEAY